jgi:catechol 2,3-dioxygenase-like lactoylglutathione lyase family enzyme
MATVQVRYIVDDIEAAIAFYVTHLGFHLDLHPAPPFAMLSLGDWLSAAARIRYTQNETQLTRRLIRTATHLSRV